MYINEFIYLLVMLLSLIYCPVLHLFTKKDTSRIMKIIECFFLLFLPN